jgi:DNA modification methylase
VATSNGRKVKPKFKIRITGFDSKPASAFKFNPLNWRRHGETQREALRQMLGDVGWVQGVIENKRTGNLIDGHARIEETLKENPGELVPFLQVDLSVAEEKAVLATLDPIGAMAEVDPDTLDQLYKETLAGMPGLDELLKVLHGPSGEDEESGADEPRDAPVAVQFLAKVKRKWKVKRGDLWTIGPHRLFCGDATRRADVARLIGKGRPAVMITDPPYGVDYDASWRVETVHRQGQLAGKKAKAIAPVTNDHRAGWRAAFQQAPVDVAYVWHADKGAVQCGADLMAAGYELRAQIVWAKPNFVVGRGHYHYQHESCWYAVREGSSGHWTGDRSQSTLWTIPSLQPMGRSQDQHDRATGHSTQKPIECMARPMRNHLGDIYDPFVGSGTTIIAAENLQRKCYALDIDPGCVALTLERCATAFPELTIQRSK